MNIFRGDTFLKEWSLKTSNGDIFKFQKGDIVIYCLYKTVNDPILKKSINISEEQNSIEIFFSSEDTKFLECGNYFLEIQLTYDRDKVQTFKYSLNVEMDAIV